MADKFSRWLLPLSLAATVTTTPAFAQPGEQADEPPAIEVTLADAVAAAVAFHPDVTTVRADNEIARVGVERVDATFAPVLTLNGLSRREDVYDEGFGTIAGDQLTVSGTTHSGDVGVLGKTKIGTTYELLFRASRQTSTPVSPLSPRFATEVSGRLTQPLLRGGWLTANRGLVEREKVNAELAAATGHERLERLVLDVVATYYALALRREEVEILRTSLEAAETLREVVERRVKAGQDARSSLIQADSTVAERRRAVEAARINVIDAEQAFLLASYLTRARDISPGDAVIPVDKAAEDDLVPDYKEELARAFESRPEVIRAERAVRLAELDHAIADNASKWRVDIYGLAGLSGLAGTPGPVADLDGGLGTSLSNLGKAPFFEVGLVIEIPLDNGDRAGAARQAKLAVDKARAVDARTRVSLDVRAAIQGLSIARNNMTISETSQELAEKNLAAQNRRYKGGGITLFDVIRAQDERSAAGAQLALARAQLEVAVANLESARGTLLARFGLTREGRKRR